jgi:hypothetical protein
VTQSAFGADNFVTAVRTLGKDFHLTPLKINLAVNNEGIIPSPICRLKKYITLTIEQSANSAEIGRLFGMKTAGCSGKSATPINGAGQR